VTRGKLSGLIGLAMKKRRDELREEMNSPAQLHVTIEI
jgi:hypothetical protein